MLRFDRKQENFVKQFSFNTKNKLKRKNSKKKKKKDYNLRDLPGGPVATTPCPQCSVPGFDPWSGN